MSRVETTNEPKQGDRLIAALTLAACVGVGLATALLSHAGWVVFVAVLAVTVGALFVGGFGLVLLAPVFACFVLLTRFDDDYALFVTERLRISVIFLITMASLALLFLCIPWRGRFPRESSAPEARFLRWYPPAWIAFVSIGLVGIGFNSFFDNYVPGRSVVKELLALGTVVIPMGFAAVIPRLNLSKRQTLRCLNVILGLGAATGLIMAVFAVMPERVISLLGWTQAAYGTLDLARGRTPLGHPNTVGAVLVVLLPVALILAFRGSDWRLRPAYWLCVASLFFGILFTLSRSTAAVACLITLATCGYLSVHRKRMLVVGLATAVVLAALGAGGAVFLFSRYDFSRLWSREYHETASMERRAASMRTALAVWQDYKGFGIGPGAFYPHPSTDPYWVPAGGDHTSLVLYYRGHVTAPHPHNMYLMLLAEWGVLGASVYLAILVLIGWTLYAARRGPQIAAADSSILSGLGLAFCSLLLMAAGDSLLLADLRPTVVFWVFLGLAMRYVVLLPSPWNESSRKDRTRALTG